MAVTGHAGSQAPQSMHSSGWIYSIVAASNSASSFFGWMQSTGHASTHAVSFVPTQGSQIMYAIESPCGCLMPEIENKTKLIQGASTFIYDLPLAIAAESILLRTFPVGVRGKSGTSSKYFGTL